MTQDGAIVVHVDTDAGTREYGGQIARVLCSPELERRLEEVSAETGAPKAVHVRRALEAYLAAWPEKT